MFNFPNIFGPATPAQPAQPAAAAAPAAGQSGAPAAGTMPNGELSTLENPSAAGKTPAGTPGTPAAADNPLEAFKGLWDDPPVDEKSGKGKPVKVGINVDPAKIREAVGKIDFSKVVDPALAAKALGGDQTAFSTILGTIAHAAVSNAMVASSQILDRALKQHDSQVFERLPGEMRKHSLTDASLADNPELQHPSVRPLFQMVQNQFASQFPDATTADLQKMTKEYMKSALGVFNKGDKTQENADKKPSGGTIEERIQALQPATNWDDVMGMGPGS
jgi:hypothetical protein